MSFYGVSVLTVFGGRHITQVRAPVVEPVTVNMIDVHSLRRSRNHAMQVYPALPVPAAAVRAERIAQSANGPHCPVVSCDERHIFGVDDGNVAAVQRDMGDVAFYANLP
jgi:hypothetical protein